jgi:hypothetical protein
MLRWILRVLLIGVIGIAGYTAFETYKKGYFSIPDIPDGSYVFSFKSGMRGIVLDADVSDPSVADMPMFLRRINFANPDRIYFGVPADLAPWIAGAWSICTSPSEEERISFAASFSEDLEQKLAHARFDAVCRIDVDGEEVVRGLLYSVPKL